MKNHPCQLPPYLQPGDLVTAIAPSGALRELEALEAGLNIWRSRGYQIELGDNWQSSCGYLAGNDDQRKQALIKAWQNPQCKAIICIRGGYGSARLLENWHWEENRSLITDRASAANSLKWVVGFSDITSLLWSLAKTGIASLHAPVLTTLAKEPQWSIERLFNYLEGVSVPSLQGKGWGGGKGKGILLPANLTVATHLLGTKLQPSLTGVILALEDVAEYPYRIDRMLTQWRLMGAFKQIKGIALGRFSRCEAPEGFNSWNISEVLLDRLGDLNIPVVSDLPFGHDGVNAALPVGQWVELNGNTGQLI
ncbi:MAG: LD-carboxypeptidase [Pleurocapsa sp.]